ncbi:MULTISPECIES: AzlC family ABC transporter permease [Arthrobacter]|uniref:AzlC family ABC transporter permease n=2 Tax=Arthrobacter TaxID=1663 RepID=A0ABU9KKG0_9MICC|nr:AzlC family ABC transporter permease [Arthrobacter sp. YJM1]MDP5227389.1 AzlC family ABC transporter permease [Arthrobacter sp. YJM1]
MPDTSQPIVSTPAAHSGFRDAVSEAGMVCLGFVPLGMGLGVLVTSHGLPWWLAPLLSGVVFAGSVEFILVGLLAASTPVLSIAATAFLVNSRHLFYGFSFPLERVNGPLAKTYSIYSLCDEAFALLSGHRGGKASSSQILWTQALLQISWVSGSVLGALLGSGFLGQVKGLGFLMVALFTILTIDAIRARPELSLVLCAAGAAVVALLIAPAQMLPIALGLFVVLLLARHWLEARRRRAAHGEAHHG